MADALTILGFGMIGASVAAAARSADFQGSILAWDPNPESLRYGRAAGLLDGRAAASNLSAGIVVVAAPVLAIVTAFRWLTPALPNLRSGSLLLTDTGSVKQPVLAAACAVFGFLPAGMVPAHPLAGSEESGAEAGDAKLFHNRRVLLTPHEHTSMQARRLVHEFWESLGAHVSYMDVGEHDHRMALCSHFPHLLAFGVMDMLGRSMEVAAISACAAGGLRDFSRIAASDPVMWRDIFLTNRDELLEILDLFLEDLQALRGLLERKDGAALEEFCRRAKGVRHSVFAAPGPAPEKHL